mmetsp:Transcript_10618/g.36036  ORF Transcript_10618/g.36036 Transcript_10618/m.36036 type:complete len:522 (+) Transcript_10618:40-1605(+)
MATSGAPGAGDAQGQSRGWFRGNRDSSEELRKATSHPASVEHILRESAYNPQPTLVPPPIAALGGNQGDMHVVVIIGLPEVGKPFLAQRMNQYLRFFHGADCKLFDVCEFISDDDDVDESARALSARVRKWIRGARSDGEGKAAEGVDGDVYRGQKVVDSGRCAILYGSDSYAAFGHKWSGSSKERRRWISEQVRGMAPEAKLIFIEVRVNDPALLHANIRNKRSALGLETTPEDLRREADRVRDFAKYYVTLQDDGSEDDLNYVVFVNYGQKVITNRMHGFLRMRIAQFLSAVHTERHSIYITRHGQSEYNRLGKIGGNSGLTELGQEYAVRLGKFAAERVCREDGAEVNKARLWTSSLRRTNDTARHIPHPVISVEGQQWTQMSHRVYRALDEIFAGEYEGLTYEEIAERHQDEAFLRKKDKIGYRYPRGESYFDIISRLDPLIHELESYHEPILVVSHQAVLRIIYAYFMGLDRMEATKVEIPLHAVIRLTYDGWCRCEKEVFDLGPQVNRNQSDGCT